LSNSITGSALTYAGGGGGGSATGSSPGTGGSGGGGNGGPNATSGISGTSNLGGGGGGGGAGIGHSGGNGGSGVVIISYPNIYPDFTSIGGGLTFVKTVVGAFKIFTFTSGTGTVTV
jgi:hypothetical protein